jgi:hypothetical protein
VYVLGWCVWLIVVRQVLQDEFITAVAREKAEAAAVKQDLQALEDKRTSAVLSGPLDAQVRGLLSFTSNTDLMRSISNLYDRLDLDDGSAVSIEELNQGVAKLKLSKPVRLLLEEFSLITPGPALLNSGREITPADFEIMMLDQVVLLSHDVVGWGP